MDILLADNLDLGVENGTYGLQQDGETTLLQAFFTDARVNNQRGYWLDIKSSEVWQFNQKRLTQQVVNDLQETAKEVADSLVNEGLYDRIETSVFIQDGVLTLQLKCYDKKNIIVNRKFAI